MSQEKITGSKAGITAAVMCAALMALIDISIVNVALSDIRASFGTPIDQIAWVSTGYMMANVVVIPMTGWLQRRFGYKRYFAVSIGMFTVASMLCGLSWNLPSLVVFRILQGMGGGAIIPTAQSILFARYPRSEHGTAGALFGLGAVTGPLLGPTIGGWMIEISGWHWIFLINVPVGILAIYLTLRHVDEPGWEPPDTPIDVVGIALLAVGMGTLQYVLEEGNRNDWLASTEIRVLAAVAVISLGTFFVHELETEHPVVDLRIFKNRGYTAATGINFLVGTALFSTSYLFSLFCGAVLHYTALDIGLVFLTAGGIQIVMMPFVGKLAGKIDGRPMLAVGIVLVTVSLWMTTRFTHQIGFWELAHARMVMGAGLSLIFVPLSVLALSDLPPDKRGNATGLFNLTRELGGSIGTAWMAMRIADGTKLAGTSLASRISLTDPATQEQLAALQFGPGNSTYEPLRAAEQILQYRIELQALVKTFDQAFTVAAVAFGCTVFLVFLLKRPRPGAAPAGAH
jgi:DHA2 family multidrug resistance protein